ncbi:hypothetical protein CEXT_553781 [Caerostris extrusa]|uniref:Uncharacterized protein n=1 Tax=Caerostris extrusa TaxID=172846 RepID=A0AAV4PU33_CAEEX|nr:hypothetical protein CEXT_553781 [Caerostris extrusa]
MDGGAHNKTGDTPDRHLCISLAVRTDYLPAILAIVAHHRVVWIRGFAEAWPKAQTMTICRYLFTYSSSISLRNLCIRLLFRVRTPTSWTRDAGCFPKWKSNGARLSVPWYLTFFKWVAEESFDDSQP